MRSNYNFYSRTEFVVDHKDIKFDHLYFKNKKAIEVRESDDNNTHIVLFSKIITIKHLKKVLKNEMRYFVDKLKVNNMKKVLIIGLGNEDSIADSIGPKVLKYIKVNSHLKKYFHDNNGVSISVLEPGVLGKTGIDTTKIIQSIKDLVEPNLIILIDSFVCDDIKLLNKSIYITNQGIIPGGGLVSLNSNANENSLKTSVITIGVPTIYEGIIDNYVHVLTEGDIDSYVKWIAKMIGMALNEFFDYL